MNRQNSSWRRKSGNDKNFHLKRPFWLGGGGRDEKLLCLPLLLLYAQKKLLYPFFFGPSASELLISPVTRLFRRKTEKSHHRSLDSRLTSHPPHFNPLKGTALEIWLQTEELSRKEKKMARICFPGYLLPENESDCCTSPDAECPFSRCQCRFFTSRGWKPCRGAGSVERRRRRKNFSWHQAPSPHSSARVQEGPPPAVTSSPSLSSSSSASKKTKIVCVGRRGGEVRVFWVPDKSGGESDLTYSWRRIAASEKEGTERSTQTRPCIVTN